MAAQRTANRALPWLQPWALTLLAGLVVIKVGRVGPDWPAQIFRSGFAHSFGFRVWNDEWYGGHALPGYSVLFPVLASVLGAGVVGLLAATASTWAGTKLLTATLPAALSTWWLAAVNGAVAVCVLGNLIIGQVPFLLGLAWGLLALLALRGGRQVLAAALAGACSLSSPLAGLFLLLAGVAMWRDLGWRRMWPFAAAGLGGLIALLIGGSSGTYPFDAYDAAGMSLFTLYAVVLLPRRLHGLRRFVLVSAVAAVALFAVSNSVGGNITRLVRLLAVPLTLAMWGLEGTGRVRPPRYRFALFASCLVAALVWDVAPVVSSVARASGDPSTEQSYYAGLLGFLSTQDPTQGRLEIPFTREHWEAAYVAPHFPLARGWERQLDVQYDEVLYHPLTAASYRAWLDYSAVDFVALPDAPLDYGGVAERALLAHPPAYLSVAYRDAHWTVFRISHPSTLLDGPAARLLSLGPSSFTVRFEAPGTAVVRLHDSPLWTTATPDVCLTKGADDWLHLRALRAGTFTLTAQVTLSTALRRTPSACDAAP